MALVEKMSPRTKEFGALAILSRLLPPGIQARMMEMVMLQAIG
jgi:hypothetical protein